MLQQKAFAMFHLFNVEKEEAISIFKKLMDSDFTNPVNLGNPKEMTIEELASTILNKIGGKSEIIYKELPEDDPKIRQPDITRAKRILNWNPKTSFDIGLEETIQDFKIRLGLN